MGIGMNEMVLLKLAFAVIFFITILIAIHGFSNKNPADVEKKRFEDTAPLKNSEKKPDQKEG